MDERSRYVKLTKDQKPVEQDIQPGELNQPIHVPQVFYFQQCYVLFSEFTFNVCNL